MKKLVLLLIFTIILTGCNKVTAEDRELAMKKAATTYYEKYAKGMFLPVPDNFDVTLDKLEAANTNVKAGLDLELLSKCNKDSKVTLSLDDNGEVTKYVYALNCDK